MNVRRWTRRVALTVVAFGVVGCGSSGTGGGGAAAGNGTTRQVYNSPGVTLIPFTDQWYVASGGSWGMPRWMDINNVIFGSGYQTGLSSPGSIIVEWAPNPDLPIFQGRIMGSGLKPNFCYQLKLMGMPGPIAGGAGGLWGTSADNATNATLVENARWWDYYDENTAAFDNSDPATEMASANYQNGWVAGYQYLGYFMTDANGNIAGTDVPGNDASLNGGWVPFDSSRSFHITGYIHPSTDSVDHYNQQSFLQNPLVDKRTWTLNYTQTPPSSGPYAGATTSTGTVPKAPVNVVLGYQTENNATGGTAPLSFNMPAGTHNVVLMVTEETFHNNMSTGASTSSSSGGTWRTVFVSNWSTGASSDTGQPWLTSAGNPVSFTTVTPQVGASSVTVTLAKSGRNYTATAKVTVKNDATGAVMPNAVVTGNWTGPDNQSASGTTNSSGVATIKSAAEPSNGGTFTFTVTGITATGYAWDNVGTSGSATE